MGKAAGSRLATAANSLGAIVVPIRRLLENHVFGPDEITVLTAAFEDTLRALRLADRADPATEIIAKTIIELAQQGEIVGGKGGKEPVANMGILHDCHWLTPAIARGCSTTRRSWTRRSWGALVGESVRTLALCGLSILDFEMRNPRSRNVSRVIASVGTVVDAQKHV